MDAKELTAAIKGALDNLTPDDRLNLARELFPNAMTDVDDHGQIILYTRLQYASEDDDTVIFCRPR